MGLGRSLGVLAVGLGLTFGGVKEVRGNENGANAQTVAFCEKLGDMGTISPDEVKPSLCAIHHMTTNGTFPVNKHEIIAKARDAIERVRKVVTEQVGIECTASQFAGLAPSHVYCRVVDKPENPECSTVIENSYSGQITVVMTCGG